MEITQIFSWLNTIIVPLALILMLWENYQLRKQKEELVKFIIDRAEVLKNDQ